MKPVSVSKKGVEETINFLQEAGKRRTECVLLWLAKNSGNHLMVEQIYRPQQTAEADIFRIPPDSMRNLMSKLSSEDLMIAAQIHSHPVAAFHSKADDSHAIVRHIHALSLVLPYFALRTNIDSFLVDTKIYKLNSKNQWVELEPYEVGKWVQIS